MIHLSEQVSEYGVYVVHLQTVERGIQIFFRSSLGGQNNARYRK